MARLDSNQYLCLDFGERRVGVAAGSMDSGLAQPLETLKRRADGEDRVLFARLREIVKERAAATIVVGDPVNMDGTAGPRAEATRAFARSLAKAIRQVRVELFDERLSTFTADESMERDGVRKSRRAEKRDAYAAAVILQDYFQAKKD